MSCGCRQERRGAGRHPGRSRKPACLPRTPARRFPLPPGSRGAADVCWTEPTLPTAPWLGEQVTGLVWGDFPLPTPIPSPGHAAARLGMLLPSAAGLGWPQVRRKRQHWQRRGTSPLNGTSAAGTRCTLSPAPAGVLAASPQTAPFPRSRIHPHGAVPLLCSPRTRGSVREQLEKRAAERAGSWGAAPQ